MPPTLRLDAAPIPLEQLDAVLEAAAPSPTLYPASAPLAPVVAQWADSALFWTVIPYTMQPAGVASVFAGVPPEVLKAFAADRAAMTVGMKRASTRDATAALQSYLGWLEQQLARQPFLCGSAPSMMLSSAESGSTSMKCWCTMPMPAASAARGWPGGKGWPKTSMLPASAV